MCVCDDLFLFFEFGEERGARYGYSMYSTDDS